MQALFERYPLIERGLPYIGLGDFPTPLVELRELGKLLGVGSLYLKNDGLSSADYGGNKVRKLELLLGEARRRKVREVLTFGFAGSNHAAATAVFARRLGMSSISMLMPQPNAAYVGPNLLTSMNAGAELQQRNSAAGIAAATAATVCRRILSRRGAPMLIPPGGSSPLGCTGFVGAAFELARQLEGQPAPDLIYVAFGSGGTAAGLLLGLNALGAKTELCAVQVAEPKYVNERKLRRLYRQTGRLLEKLDPGFPLKPLTKDRYHIIDDCLGPGYAHFTEEGMTAVRRMKDLEGVTLDGTYTGKTLAALERDAARGVLANKSVLLWNTYNSQPLAESTSELDYHRLPACFHVYFESNVQALDRTLPDSVAG